MKGGRNGFTLVEIMVVVVIIGLLAGMAIPAFKQARLNARFGRFMNDVRTFSAAVEVLYSEKGAKPVDSGSGTLDPELADYIDQEVFLKTSPIGGQWDVESDDSGIGLGVGVHGYTLTAAELQMLDERFDDGNLDSGRLRDIVSGSRYYWVIEP